jgi:hypothetical protein
MPILLTTLPHCSEKGNEIKRCCTDYGKLNGKIEKKKKKELVMP